MPITLPPISRRRFLAGSVAAAASVALGPWSLALQAARTDPNRFVLISDTHIDADLAKTNRQVNMADNLKAAVASFSGLDPMPAAVFHGGDIAHSTGEPGDYAAALDLLKPAREAGLPIHLTMGNHDHRDNFWKSTPPGKDPLVEQKHIAVVATPLADWYLLDTLDKPKAVPGLLGEKQLAWLTTSLDASPNKPAIVVMHHNPLVGPPRPFGGLQDYEALFAVLNPRKQVKLLVYGHTHDFSITEGNADRPHYMNLPPVAYPFDKSKPSGWIDCTLADAGGAFKLVCLNEKHALHNKVSKLNWR